MMDKFKRTFTFRTKKSSSSLDKGSKPLQWNDDERKVREGSCSFQVKYLGSIEVFESRGMPVCEEAMRQLLKYKSKKMVKRAILYVSGDALRVTEEISKGLMVDQVIEKVSFCAPDRNQHRGFAYICRDAATRRWLCHGFKAVKESGERLSHAVGCAFAVCLERKQQREKESVDVTFNENKTSFTRLGSFKQATIIERLQDPQSVIIPEAVPNGACVTSKSVDDQSSIPRPHASQTVLERQSSLRIFPKLQDGQKNPFKRDYSVRLTDLSSNHDRKQLWSSSVTIKEESNDTKPQTSVATIPEKSTVTQASNGIFNSHSNPDFNGSGTESFSVSYPGFENDPFDIAPIDPKAHVKQSNNNLQTNTSMFHSQLRQSESDGPSNIAFQFHPADAFNNNNNKWVPYSQNRSFNSVSKSWSHDILNPVSKASQHNDVHIERYVNPDYNNPFDVSWVNLPTTINTTTSSTNNNNNNNNNPFKS